MLTSWAAPVPAAQDIAWVWPASDAPPGPLREAAVLVESVLLRGGGVARQLRLRPLVLAHGVRVTPVVHVQVQAGVGVGAALSALQRDAVLGALRRHAAQGSSGWVQLDFEAPARQRQAYLSLVAQARQSLPHAVRLSVTALALWCRQGNWLDQLAADEVVPMLYRLGPAGEQWKNLWTQTPELLHPKCRGQAAGFSVQEMPGPLLVQKVSRRYWFNERNWSPHQPTRLPP